MNNNKKTAFTLIELLIVVVIIGVLVSVGVPAYSGYQTITKKEVGKSQCSTIYQRINNEMVLLSSGSKSLIPDISIDKSPTELATAFKTDFDKNNYKNPWKADEVVISIVNSSLDETDPDDLGNISIIGDDTLNTLKLECVIEPDVKKTSSFKIE